MSSITHFEICSGVDCYGLPIALGRRGLSRDETAVKLKRYRYLPAYRDAVIVEVVSTCCEGEFPIPSILDRSNERPDGVQRQMTPPQLRLVPRSIESPSG